MAKKNTSATDTKVTRISAKDDGKTTRAVSKKTTSDAKKTAKVAPAAVLEERTRNPLKALWRYFKGAWHELMQVRWPTRRNTWSLTGAVILFTLFFVGLILLLDSIFQRLFNQFIG